MHDIKRTRQASMPDNFGRPGTMFMTSDFTGQEMQIHAEFLRLDQRAARCLRRVKRLTLRARRGRR